MSAGSSSTFAGGAEASIFRVPLSITAFRFSLFAFSSTLPAFASGLGVAFFVADPVEDFGFGRGVAAELWDFFRVDV